MRSILLLAILLTSAPAYAGSEVLIGVIQGSTTQPFTINGYSSISSSGTQDTGTETISTGAGDITVAASCFSTNTAGNQVDVHLIVDGTDTALICGQGETKTATLVKTVTAGNHTARVYGAYDTAATDTFSASGFKKPRP